MDSSVDVCDLMVEFLCKTCSDRTCAEDDGQGDGPWSHSKLMDCIKKVWADMDVIDGITFYELERVIHLSVGDKIVKRFLVSEHSTDDPMHWKVVPPGPCPGVVYNPPKKE